MVISSGPKKQWGHQGFWDALREVSWPGKQRKQVTRWHLGGAANLWPLCLQGQSKSQLRNHWGLMGKTLKNTLEEKVENRMGVQDHPDKPLTKAREEQWLLQGHRTKWMAGPSLPAWVVPPPLKTKHENMDKMQRSPSDHQGEEIWGHLYMHYHSVLPCHSLLQAPPLYGESCHFGFHSVAGTERTAQKSGALQCVLGLVTSSGWALGSS